MEQTGRFRILGVKGFKGSIDGQSFDSTTLFVEMPFSKRSQTEVGCNAVAVKFGKEDEFQKLKGLTFPLIAELEYENTTKGMECYGFKAVAPAASPGQTK